MIWNLSHYKYIEGDLSLFCFMVAFEIFGFQIYWYGIFYFIAFLIGYLFLYLLGKKQLFKQYPWVQNVLTTSLDGLMICILAGVLLGGRLGHFIIYDFATLQQNPWEFFYIWHGGMSFIWGILGVIIALLIFKQKLKISWEDLLIILDCILIIVPIGIALGRFWNYLNQELYGIIFQNPWFSEGFVQFLTNINILHRYPRIDENIRINTNLLSIIFEGIFILIVQIFLFISMIKHRKYYRGRLCASFVLMYSFFRFLFEFLRNDSQNEIIGLLSKSQWFFLIFFIIGINIFRDSLKHYEKLPEHL